VNHKQKNQNSTNTDINDATMHAKKSAGKKFPEPSLLTFAIMTSIQSESVLRSNFDMVMNASNDRFLKLLGLQESSVSKNDIEFMKDAANLSMKRLTDKSVLLKRELASLHHTMETQLFIEGRGSIDASIESLESVLCHDIPTIKSRITSFNVTSGTISSSHFGTHREEKASLSNLIQQHAAIADFLEIPQLVESCIRTRQYNEAMKILDNFSRMYRRFNHENKLMDMISNQLRTIQENLVRSIEQRLTCEEMHNMEEIESLLYILSLYHVGVKANMPEYFLMFRMEHLLQAKAGIQSVTSPWRQLHAYATLLANSLVLLAQQFSEMFAPDIQPESQMLLDRFLVQEVDSFEIFLREKLPSMYIELSKMDEVFRCVTSLSYALGTLNISADFSTLFKGGYVHTIIEKRLKTKIFESFKSELDEYNFEAFTSLLPSDGGEFDTIQLTRHRPLAVLMNDMVALMNDMRHFPLRSIVDEFIHAIDEVIFRCFDLTIGKVAPEATKGEYSLMRKNFCAILVMQIEVHLESLFGRKIELVSIKNHPQFLFRATKALSVGNDPNNDLEVVE